MEEYHYKNLVWADLVLGKMQVSLNYLAAKILISRWQLAIKKDPSPANLEKGKKEIFNLYKKSLHLPSAQKDVQHLLHLKEVLAK